MELLHVLSKRNRSGESVAIRLQLKKWGSAGPLATLPYETRIQLLLWVSKSGSKPEIPAADPFIFLSR
jgi:hypothetical protein